MSLITSNDLEYSFSISEQKINKAGFEIKIIQDSDIENPFQSWDCEPSILTYYDSLNEYCNYSDKKTDLKNPLIWLKDYQFKGKKLIRLIESTGFSVNETLQRIKDYSKDYSCSKVEAARDILSDILSDLKPGNYRTWHSHIEYLDCLESLWNMAAGFKAQRLQSNGYSQGDCALILVIVTKDYCKNMGIKPKNIDQKFFDNVLKLYSAWVWGDIYGYSIKDKTGDYQDSCFGFYGNDPEFSGILENINSQLSYLIESKKSDLEIKILQLRNHLRELFKELKTVSLSGTICQTVKIAIKNQLHELKTAKSDLKVLTA